MLNKLLYTKKIGKMGSISLEFKIEDCWVGAFWKTNNIQTVEGDVKFSTDIWICLLPCLPIHITYFWYPTINHR